MAGSETGYYDVASELLAVCAAALATTPAGAPARQYVSPGPPAFDCEQLTVHGSGLGAAQTQPLAPALAPGMRDFTTGNVLLVTLTVTVIRCVPVLAGPDGSLFPAADALDNAAATTHTDVWAIWNGVIRAHAAKPPTVFARPDGQPREVFFDGAAPVATMGGLAGWSIQLRVQADGYRPA